MFLAQNDYIKRLTLYKDAIDNTKQNWRFPKNFKVHFWRFPKKVFKNVYMTKALLCMHKFFDMSPRSRRPFTNSIKHLDEIIC